MISSYKIFNKNGVFTHNKFFDSHDIVVIFNLWSIQSGFYAQSINQVFKNSRWPEESE
jgi:hypothetical protein